MKAIVAEKAGTPDVLTLKEIAKPDAKAGWVLIQVKAFGLNRAELFTRQGDSPGVTFPRVLGIEAVGIVESAPNTPFKPGQIDPPFTRFCIRDLGCAGQRPDAGAG